MFEERLYRKQHLATAFRVFADRGFDEGIAGHISVRDSILTDHFWLNPLSMHVSQIKVSDLILVDEDGFIVEGDQLINTAAFTIHSAIHKAPGQTIDEAAFWPERVHSSNNNSSIFHSAVYDQFVKILDISGMGVIGRQVARRARAFGMVVRYRNRSTLAPEFEEGAEYVSFDVLLEESDVLSLNLPLTAKTHHLISHHEFGRMKDKSVIFNIARGAIIDEEALVAALQSGKISSAGLDVFENEPEVHPGLLSNPHVLLVPHMGTLTVETGAKMEETANANVKEYLGTNTAPGQVSGRGSLL
ncbi:unnamed protein product [Clonostachys rosea]|uniref:Class II aldolase/adducin N-terminal domain-containing protein n=1 Tax=Bionectria ochroleuca TaxID=29856 RepID=A0ABY6TZ30_BIOOC|nr:unnamed protein product [Clonostachys rosea]